MKILEMILTENNKRTSVNFLLWVPYLSRMMVRASVGVAFQSEIENNASQISRLIIIFNCNNWRIWWKVKRGAGKQSIVLDKWSIIKSCTIQHRSGITPELLWNYSGITTEWQQLRNRSRVVTPTNQCQWIKSPCGEVTCPTDSTRK